MKKRRKGTQALTQSSGLQSCSQTKQLEEVCNVEYGTRVVQKRDGGKGFPVFGGGGATFEMDVFNREDRLVVSRFGMSEECTRFVAGKFFLNDSGLTVSPKDEVILQRFLDYQMLALNDRIYALGKGAAQKNLDVPAFRTLPLFVPVSIVEQQRIVGLLDEAFEGIATAKANAEKNLQNARALFESHLQSVFTQRGPKWLEKTLEEISNSFGRGKSKHRPRNAPHLYGGKYPFVQTGDIRNADHIITEYSQTYSEAGLAQSKLWPKGTICITIAANIAETAILGFDACFPDSVIGLVANPKEAEVGFIEYLLQSFKARIQAMGKGSAQANINMGTFENERFPFPPVAEQKRVVAKLDALSEETQHLVSLYEEKLAALEALKKSLLHQAFSGQL
jgi:type I restriction enzyme S subunit